MSRAVYMIQDSPDTAITGRVLCLFITSFGIPTNVKMLTTD